MLEWRKICCAVDFSVSSRQALRVAAQLAKRLDAELLLLHVRERPHLSGNAETEIGTELAIEATMERAALQQWRAEAREQCEREVEAVTTYGTPAEAIVDFAKRAGCELLVLGTQGRTGFQRAIFGSVAEKVVRLSHCPVLTVHPPEQAAKSVAGVV